MRNYTKNISTILKLFGYKDASGSWFISNEAGIVSYPKEAFRADFYVYVLCSSGQATLLVNNEKLLIRRGMFLSAIPSTLLQVKDHSKDFRARVLIFERAFLLKNILDARQLEHLGFFNYNSLAQLNLKKSEWKMLGDLFTRMYERSIHDGVFHNEIMQSLIFNLLFETAEIYSSYYHLKRKKTVSREEEIFLKFMKLVAFHFRSQEPLQFYSSRLFISDKYLIQVCREIAGKTPGEILAEALVNEAKLLLNNPDNNITMVSQQLNYSSVAAFSKFFKKQAGIAPSKSRKYP